MRDPRPKGDARDQSRVSIVTLLPNMITLTGMSLGLTAIRFAMEGRFATAVFMILLAMLADGLDGFVARRFGAESQLGAQLDSLSDFLCFGVAPAIVVYQVHLTHAAGYGWIFVLVFAAAICLRLARFNVMSGQADASAKPRSYFVGVPAPAGAFLGLLPVLVTLTGGFAPGDAPVAVAFWLTVVAILTVSKLRTISPKGVRVPRRLVVLILFATVIVIGIGFTRPWLVLVLLDAAYLATVLYALVRARGRIFS